MAAVLMFACTLFLGACGSLAPSHVQPDPALLTLIPSDTVMLIGARLDHLRQTSFFKQHMDGEVNPALVEFMEQTGIDPTKDIWEVLAVSNGIDTVIMSRGKYSATGLEPRVEMEGASRTSYKGYLLVGDKKKAITFMNATTAVVGRPERLRRIIDQRSQSHKPPDMLLEKIKSIDRSSQIWVVSIGGFAQSGVPAQGNMANLDPLLRRLKSLTAAVNLNSGAVVTAVGDCASAEDAETLRSALRTLIGLSRMGLRDQPATQAVLEKFAIGREENLLHLGADIPSDLLSRLLAEMQPVLD